MKKSLRIIYYNIFSHFYDLFIALHSTDKQGKLRNYLAEKIGLKKGNRVLDLCTGTGSLLLSLEKHVGKNGIVVGLDFSRGMLNVAKSKMSPYKNIYLIEADASMLPFKEGVFDAVTCSHAFYELKGETQKKALKEIVYILKKGKSFFMMEHDVPNNLLIRILFYIRIFSMGSKKALNILKKEEKIFKNYFSFVHKIKTETGRSKIIIGTKV